MLRHGHAVARDDWNGADRDRPLRNTGRRQAAALVSVAREYAIQRVISSPATRCVQTVTPLLVDAEARIELLPGLGEEATAAQHAVAVAAVLGLLHGEQNALVCSHRPVLPGLFDELAAASGVVPPAEPLRPGEYIVIRGAALPIRGRS